MSAIRKDKAFMQELIMICAMVMFFCCGTFFCVSREIPIGDALW